MSNKQKLKQAAAQTVAGIITFGGVSKPQLSQDDLARLQNALRKERILGQQGHWAYDINRHFYLAQCVAKVQK